MMIQTAQLPTGVTLEYALPGWEAPRPGWLARNSGARRLVAGLADRLGMVHFFLQSPYFRLPDAAPRVTAEAPLLSELWQQGERQQLHLVNYAEDAQTVRVEFAQPVAGEMVSPKRGSVQFIGVELELTLNLYTVLEYAAKA